MIKEKNSHRKKKKKWGYCIDSLGGHEVIADWCDIVSRHLTEGDVTSELDIIGTKRSPIWFSKVIDAKCPVEVNPTRGCGEIVIGIKVTTPHPNPFS